MNSLATVVDEVIDFHEQLCRDWEHAATGLIEPDMMLYVPDAFPWQPLKTRGIEALREFRDALHVISDGTFQAVPQGSTADERLVAIRCHEAATRRNCSLEWSSLWVYVLTDGRISETRVVHAVPSDLFENLWCT